MIHIHICICVYGLHICEYSLYIFLVYSLHVHVYIHTHTIFSVHVHTCTHITLQLAISYSRRTPQPRDQAPVFCIVGRLLHCRQILYHWTTREAPQRKIVKNSHLGKIFLCFKSIPGEKINSLHNKETYFFSWVVILNPGCTLQLPEARSNYLVFFPDPGCWVWCTEPMILC